jgi:6-phosphogluconolactonase
MKNRLLCGVLAALSAFAIPIGAQLPAPASQPKEPAATWVYVGTLAKRDKQGIYRFRMNNATGQLTAAGDQPEIATPSPSFLALHPNGKILYAATATKIADYAGAIESFTIDAATGKLTLLNREPSGGAEPVHIVIDPTGKSLFVANYSGASVAVLPLADDGRLKPPSAMVKHAGSSIDPGRQKQPYPHGLALDPTGKRLVVADLGTDKIVAYDVDTAKSTLVVNENAGATVKPGSGPRHLTFSLNGKFLYVLSELTNTLDSFTVDEKLALKPLKTISPWPDAKKGKDFAAEITIEPNGKFLYASLRDKDIITTFSISPDTGDLKPVGNAETHGSFPRHFALTPDGNHLIAANQKANSLVTLKINAEVGTLTPTATPIEAPAPVCVVFVPAN